MKMLLPLALALAAAGQQAGADPVAECRAAHRGDSAAHIACLERALGAQPATAPAPAPAAASAGQATGLGAEQARARQRDPDAAPEEAAVAIVSVAYGNDGRGLFRMADGQVWRETEISPARNRLRTDQQYTARIVPARFGSYRMYVDGVRRMIKLERLQ